MYFSVLTKSSALQGHLVLGDVLVELAVEAEPADLAQAVAVLVEELLVEEGLGLLRLRRVARPQPDVDLQQRLLVARRQSSSASVLRISGSRTSSITSTFLMSLC